MRWQVKDGAGKVVYCGKTKASAKRYAARLGADAHVVMIEVDWSKEPQYCPIHRVEHR